MKDINGTEFQKGGHAFLLCEVLGVENDGVAVRVCNSEMTLFVDAKPDEVFGGLVVSSELTALVLEEAPAPADNFTGHHA